MSSQHVQAAEALTGRVVSIMYSDGVFRDRPVMQNQLWAKGPMKAFLPEGYPHSVTSDYASTYTGIQLVKVVAADCDKLTTLYTGFQLWDSIQAVCSYVRGILSSQAMLTGVGVGQQAGN